MRRLALALLIAGSAQGQAVFGATENAHETPSVHQPSATSAAGRAGWPAELDAYIEKARVDFNVPGIGLTVVQDGKVLVAKGYGFRRHGSPERVDAHTMFDIASISKSFTATAMATLVDEGKMRWDDPVRRHLPSFELRDPYRTQHATIRDLLAHRLNLERGDQLFVFGNYTAAQIVERMRYLDELGGFRAGMAYHNLSYGAAGEAAAAAAGMPLAELLRTRLIEPLGMRESTVGIHHDVGVTNYSDGHSISDGTLKPIRARKALNILGANAVNTTPHDAAKWMLFHLGDGTWEGKRIVSQAAMREMHEPQVVIATTPEMRAARGVHYFAAYGLGWNIMDYRGHRMIWHSGGADGMPTYMAILPEKKIGVCVMVNTWHAPLLHGALAARVLDTLLGLPLRDTAAETLEGQRRNEARAAEQRAELEKSRVRDTKPSLASYDGTYVDELYGEMVVKEGTLQFAGGETGDLTHWHHDTFRLRWRDRAYDWADTLVTFTLAPDGKTARRLEFRAGRAEIDAVRK